MFLKLTDSPEKVSKDINIALAKEINRTLNKNYNKVITSIQKLIPKWVTSQPEVVSLLTNGPGTLNAQFGLPIGSANIVIESIVKAVVDSVVTKFTKIDKNLKGYIEFYIQPEDFQNLLSLGEGHVITEKLTDLHWLNWLLTMGDTIIITGYAYKPESGLGRSGGGNMDSGGYWRVDPKYSGTKENNFITRALSGREKEIGTILAGILT